ncbi:MAG: LysM peptidoglycan-binding domain-containing protein [Thermoanaerobaculia bacterium]
MNQRSSRLHIAGALLLILLGTVHAAADGDVPPDATQPTLVQSLAEEENLVDVLHPNGEVVPAQEASADGGSVVGGPVDDQAVGGDLSPAVDGDPLADGDQSLSTREAFERAITWSAEGVRLYQSGDHQGARKNLNDARIVLLEADLPEVLQERGLSILSSTLPARFGHHDLEALAQRLELELAAVGDMPERELIEREVRRILHRFGAPTPRPAYLEIFVDEVQHYVDYYRGNGREFFERAFERKHKYWPTIEKVFSARGIPTELGYMALVESGFNPRAYSSAKARGVWQFIYSTGKRYQLRNTEDFYDSVKATEAAAEYLLDLISIFGAQSPLLAIAAYNAGEQRIQNCLRGIDDPFGKRTFWEIRPCLARESREYVPRILAAAVIGSDPRRFGFDVLTAEQARERFDVVSFPTVTRLSAIAKTAGVSVADLRVANTDLRSNATTTPARNFPLYVPKGGGARLAQTLQASPTPPVSTQQGSTQPRAANRPAPSSPVPERTAPRGQRLSYRVARGDTLSEIAQRYGVSHRDIASWNRLRSPYTLQVGQRLTVYPGGALPSVAYTVRRGNSLSTIADLFSVRIRDIMTWNNLRSSRLRAGQKLTIQPRRPVQVESYRVRRGDTVAKIARRFGVPVRNVLTANGLGSRSLIRPGERLVVYVTA